MADITWKKSIIVGLVVLLLDYYAHTHYANYETYYYYVAKIVIGAFLAYYMYEGKDKIYNINFNPLKFKNNTTNYYLSWSVGFAAIHGLYYRILEVIQGNPFFSRVGEIHFGSTAFEGNIIMLALGWTIIHGGAFFLGILAANSWKK